MRKYKSKFLILLVGFLFLIISPYKTYASETFIYDDLEFKYEHDALWVKVFYHNSTTREWFSSLEETLNSNTQYKYSILGRINEFKTGNTYEFLLEYPEISGYNRWTQTSNPTTTTEKVLGYNPISISWENFCWHGLCLSDNASTFIDGSVGHSNWYYAIGCKNTWQETNHFPSNSTPVQEVYLWLRVDGNYNLYDEYEKAIKVNHTFAKVFTQNTRYSAYYTSAEEAKSISNYYNYSILNELETFYINNKYEFYLEYPELSGYNHWTQTSNPVTTSEGVHNYTPISISWNQNYWGGLCASSSGACFLDGSVNHGNWWYSIACYKNKWPTKTSANYDGFPGPNDVSVSICNLYARVDDGKDLIEPTISVNPILENSLTRKYEITTSNDSNLSSLKIYDLNSKNNLVNQTLNQQTYATTCEISENGIYLVETQDNSGNINKKAIVVSDINNEVPMIGKISIVENNGNFMATIELTSKEENFDKFVYYLSQDELEESALDEALFVETTTKTMNFDIKESNFHYLYVYAYNKNGLRSSLYKTQLVANVEVVFIDENGEELSKISVPYGSDVTNQTPTLQKQGYTLSWSEDLTNITINKTIQAIWTIEPNYADYSIAIPKSLILDDVANGCDYVLKIKGTFGENAMLTVQPEEAFYLNDVSGVKDPVLVKITQEKTTLTKDDFIDSDSFEIKGKITLAEELTAGMWKGSFVFNITTTPINK